MGSRRRGRARVRGNFPRHGDHLSSPSRILSTNPANVKVDRRVIRTNSRAEKLGSTGRFSLFARTTSVHLNRRYRKTRMDRLSDGRKCSTPWRIRNPPLPQDCSFFNSLDMRVGDFGFTATPQGLCPVGNLSGSRRVDPSALQPPPSMRAQTTPRRLHRHCCRRRDVRVGLPV